MRNNRARGNVLSIIFLILISCITQVATLMKSSIVAENFGTTEVIDAYNFANSILSFIFGIVASGVPTIILPAYVNQRDRKGIDVFITLLYSSLMVLVGAIVLLRYQIVYTFSNRSEMFANIACDALLILVFFQYLTSFSGITTAYFQNKEKPNIPKLVNLFSQVFVVIYLALNRDIDIYTYIIIISIGLLLSFVLDIIVAIKEGWRYRLSFEFNHPVARELLQKFWPVMFSSGIYNLSLFIDSMIAANLDEGKLTILSYSNQIVSMVNSLIIGNLMIYAYPKLIRKLSGGKNQGYFWRQLPFYHMIVCLLIVGFLAVGEEGVALLFQRGAFDPYATRYVYLCTLLYLFGQQLTILRSMTYRYFYCIGDTKAPAKNSVIVTAINILVSLILVKMIGLFGIILGTVIASFASTIMIQLRLHNAIRFTLDFKVALFKLVKNMISMVCTALIVYFSKSIFTINNLVIEILIFGVETITIYGLIELIINRDTIKAIKE